MGSVCEGILWSDSRPAEEEGEDEHEVRKNEIPHLTQCPKLCSAAELRSEVSRNALHPEVIPQKFEVKIKCLDADFVQISSVCYQIWQTS